MSVDLQKGQKVDLRKADGGKLTKVLVGLGWDEARAVKHGLKSFLFGSAAQSIDCDASAFLCKNGKLTAMGDIIYFGNLTHSSGAVQHMGDNLTGAGDGDDEQIVIDLDRVPPEYDKIVVAVNIYQADQRKQHFGLIQNAFIRIVDGRNNSEMCIYNLTEDYSGMKAVLFGEIYRYNGEWKFNPIGQGTTDNSIDQFCRRYR